MYELEITSPLKCITGKGVEICRELNFNHGMAFFHYVPQFKTTGLISTSSSVAFYTIFSSLLSKVTNTCMCVYPPNSISSRLEWESSVTK